jgi:capsular exopolysaccharide synthesis family protein
MSWNFLNVMLKRSRQQDASGDKDAEAFYDRKTHGFPGLQKSVEERLLHIRSALSVIEGNLYEVGGGKFIYITSCDHGEGKTITAIALALGLAENDRQVLLIDSNSQNPSVHTCFQTPISPGLSFLDHDEIVTSSLVRKTIYANLSIMPLGYLPDNRHTATSQVMHLKNSGLLEQYDFVVVDGHSVLNSSHASLVAKQFDGLILVVQCERTKKQVISQVAKKIHQADGRLLGVVLNRRKFYIPKFLYDRI